MQRFLVIASTVALIVLPRVASAGQGETKSRPARRHRKHHRSRARSRHHSRKSAKAQRAHARKTTKTKTATGPAKTARKAPARTASTDPEVVKAKKLFAKGARHYQAGHIEKALGLFREAYQHWKDPRILLNIAICHLELGDQAEAVRVLRAGMARMPQDKQPLFRKKLPPKLVQADKEAVEVTVRSTEPGVVIRVDGKPLGGAPVTWVVMPGKHRLEAEKNGNVVASKEVDAAPGGKVDWLVSVQPQPPAQTSTRGVRPKATKPGFVAQLKKLGQLPLWYMGAAAVLTVVAGATMIGLGVKTNKLEDDYFAHPTTATRDKGIRYRAATNAMIGVTVGAAVATGVLALFTDWAHPLGHKEKALSVTPLLGRGSGGLTLSGGF